jgi:hypothetical protein
MADIAPAVVTGGMGISGVAIGAGLTYWLGALNRSSGSKRGCDALARNPTKGLSRLRKYCIWTDDLARGTQVAGGATGVGRAVEAFIQTASTCRLG